MALSLTPLTPLLYIHMDTIWNPLFSGVDRLGVDVRIHLDLDGWLVRIFFWQIRMRNDKRLC